MNELYYRCDHGGSSIGAMNPWNWPPDNPTHTIWLHERCEAPWYDSNGLPEGVPTAINREIEVLY